MRTKLQFKQKDVAQKLGTSVSYLNEVIHDKRRPSRDTAKVWSQRTGTCPMVWLYGTVDDIKNLISVIMDQ
jgi:transcriptional regulator with XRE-family HTH domain